MRPISLAQYRASVRILGEKSVLFDHKKEIFDGLEMGLSHEQIHYFLTSQKGLKISRQALTYWLKKYKNTNEVKNQPNNGVQEKDKIINQPKVEPTMHLKVDDKVDDRALKVREKMGAATDGLPDGLLEMFSHTILKN